LSPNLGPDILNKNIGTTVRLFNSKLAALRNQWNQNKSEGMKPFDDRFLAPEAKEVLTRLGNVDVSKAGTSTTGQITVTDPRGTVHTFSNQAAADSFKKAAGIQ
jgi:hypothetical protein